ncbi:MAG: hypothetical protein Q8S58_19470 [Bosea sp. (in: a-proteobacteria)]|uniref:hypothetical protein n=1 Tax=Bosea sp. (in: a-proteobacteria) TaxID=1871050 RepID=UPI002737491F|nr:hypothetical protein [Bosea sp. (in: a-proteobacteria)]MDP3255032.1 hypothetical protein [Bosea sp. (in: a-proteobacteria)]MDP3321308.1 hypothetical protein [Bosea sp. (in: a-proteobacteria)]
MAETDGAAYLKAGGADLFKKHTSKIFRKRDNRTLLDLDVMLNGYPTIPRENRERRTKALLAIIALCQSWLSDKKTKVEGHSSFRAPFVKTLHDAAVSALRGIETFQKVKGHFVAKKNWDTAIAAVRKIVPEGSTHGADGQPVQIMQQDNWLEILDTHHRRGQELKKHYDNWLAAKDPCTFWEYLEKRSPNELKELQKVAVNYIDDLVFRDLFIVSFAGNRMRSRMSPPVQNMVIRKWSHETVMQNAEEKLLDTTTWPSTALHGLTDGWGAFVLSPQEVVYVGIHVSGQFHHSSFLCGAPVLAAGMIKVEQGRIRGIHEKNGHYRSREAHMLAFLKLLQRKLPGTDWHDVEYYSTGGAWMTVGQKLNLPRRPPVPSRANRGPLPSTLASPQAAAHVSGGRLAPTTAQPQAQPGRVRNLARHFEQ